jgi:glycine cleavage system transcriptional repressor
MQQLIVCATGPHRPDLLKTLSKALLDCGGNIADCYTTIMGDQMTVMMRLSGSWDAVVRVESLMPRLQTQLGLEFITKRTEVPPTSANFLPYMVEIVALYHPHIVYEITSFFASRQILVIDLIAHRYPASQTEALMFTLTLTIHIPTNLSIADLRNEFMDLCDDLNLDAMLWPVK